MIANIFYGLLLTAGGIAILKYRKTVHDWTGGWGWAEHYLGRGGTMLVLCLIACLMIGLGVVKFFGKLDLGAGQIDVNRKVQLSQQP
ncbi:MAG: hypothetical protein PHU93_04175 [Candidatus Gracilibacteria bacterium]|nr:hypothetical protein [Candidatus Gracilibacteria bacterium]